MAESDVQVSPAGSGPNIRTLQITTLVGGALTTVQMQVVAVTDLQGNLLSLGTLASAAGQDAQTLLLGRIARACERFANIPSLE